MLVHSVSEGDGIGDCVGVRELARVLLSEGLTWCVCVCNIERDGKCFFDATCQSVNIYFFENFVSGKIEQLAEAVSKIMLSRN